MVRPQEKQASRGTCRSYGMTPYVEGRSGTNRSGQGNYVGLAMNPGRFDPNIGPFAGNGGASPQSVTMTVAWASDRVGGSLRSPRRDPLNPPPILAERILLQRSAAHQSAFGRPIDFVGASAPRLTGVRARSPAVLGPASRSARRSADWRRAVGAAARGPRRKEPRLPARLIHSLAETQPAWARASLISLAGYS
jgi:hypothetical protein